MPNAFRSHFPSLEARVHLASCSYAPHSTLVNDALNEMLDELGHACRTPWPAYERKLVALRASVAELLNCETTQVGLMPNASVGAYQVANSMDWSARPRIVSSMSEFPSIAQVWKAQTLRGAEWVMLECGPHPDDLLEAYGQALDERVGLVSLPAIDYLSGARLPVREIAALARRFGATTFCDAYQWVGTEAIDAADTGIDYLVAGAMKYLLAWPGIAFLYARQPQTVQRISELTGWQGRPDPFGFDPFDSGFPNSARRFETGTPAFASIYAAVAGIRALLDLGLSQVAEHIARLKRDAAQVFDERGLKPSYLVPPSRTGGHFGFRVRDADALAHHFLQRRVHVSSRLNAVRVAFHAFNQRDDIESLGASLVAARDAGLLHWA